jgi:NADH-quinone oxidoreductase subunit C
MIQFPQGTISGVEAVTEALAEHPAIQQFITSNGSLVSDVKLDRGELTITVAPATIRTVCATLKEAGYNFFEDMTAVDWYPASPRFQLSYHLLSLALRERIRVRTFLDEAKLTISSITPLWPAANFFEREVFDLFGIGFEDHPNLRRIMLPDDWEGHPLRKDYPVEGYR